MENKQMGWVIMSIKHPATGKPHLSNGSFRYTRKMAIDDFIKSSGYTWEYWRTKYNFRAVKAVQILKTQP